MTRKVPLRSNLDVVSSSGEKKSDESSHSSLSLTDFRLSRAPTNWTCYLPTWPPPPHCQLSIRYSHSFVSAIHRCTCAHISYKEFETKHFIPNQQSLPPSTPPLELPQNRLTLAAVSTTTTRRNTNSSPLDLSFSCFIIWNWPPSVLNDKTAVPFFGTWKCITSTNEGTMDEKPITISHPSSN